MTHSLNPGPKNIVWLTSYDLDPLNTDLFWERRVTNQQLYE